jgi:hypothetical protein
MQAPRTEQELLDTMTREREQFGSVVATCGRIADAALRRTGALIGQGIAGESYQHYREHVTAIEAWLSEEEASQPEEKATCVH